MPRRPIEQEVRGLQTPRERVWASIRRLQKGFTTAQVQDGCAPMVLITCVDDYFDDLVAAGYLQKVGHGERIKGMPAHVTRGYVYDLVKDQHEAPRVNGGKVGTTQGMGTLAMWRAMKVLKNFDFHDIAQAASQHGLVVTEATAKSYVKALAKAGYLQELKEGKPGTATRYRLNKNTGPHAPAITRRKCVFDRNLGKFAELETAQEVCDALPE